MSDQPLKVERQNWIRRLVLEKRRVTVLELSTLMAVSEATVRRDLDELDGQGLRRIHGGAIAIEIFLSEPPVLQRVVDQTENKRRIARAAVRRVQDGDTIFISSGSTTLEIARQLPEGKRLTVISNSLPVVNELAGRSSVELVVVGGMFRPGELSMVGHPAEMALRDFRADLAFMGMRAIHPRQGFTNDYLPEIQTDRSILSMASRVIIVADHTKFGRVCSVFVAPVTAAHSIITDDGVDPQIVQELSAMGITVETV
jgi:DeoR/GlpR family transcriptional regulator of sugar metabolism